MLPTETELRKRYGSYTTNRLLYIVHNKTEYTPQALKVAHAELADRNITAADVDVFLDEQEQRRVLEKVLSCVSLTFAEKALCFFVWFAPLVPRLVFRFNYREQHFLLKVKQSQVFAIAGFIAMILTGIAVIFFRLGAGSPAILLPGLFLVFVFLEKKIVYELTL